MGYWDECEKKLSNYCRMLKVTRQGFYKYLANKDRPGKYQDLADTMGAIASEDECNDAYGRIRMYQVLLLKQPKGVRIPGKRTVYRIMKKIGGPTETGFCICRATEKMRYRHNQIKAKDEKLYVSAIFDCYDTAVLWLAMDTDMKAVLCERTLDISVHSYPALMGAIIHSDRGTQYTSDVYRKAVAQNGICQGMNSAGGRCHDNARCESMWARMKNSYI